MLVTARPSFAPGVVAAATAPVTVLFASWLLVTWSGGFDEFSRLMSAAGPFAFLVVLSGMVELAFLTLMVCHIGTGRLVPLAVMLGMATLPWTVGLLGTEATVGKMVAALGGMDVSDARNALALGVGEAMASRMLGAWMSAALLTGLGLGLAMAGAFADVPWRPAPRGSTASLLFGVIVAFVLAAIALVGALEAHQLFALLTHLPQAPLSERVGLLSEAAEDMTHLRPIRQSCQALLAALGGVLVIWRARRAASPARGWMGSAFLAAAVTSLLMLDSHPLHFAEQSAREKGLGSHPPARGLRGPSHPPGLHASAARGPGLAGEHHSDLRTPPLVEHAPEGVRRGPRGLASLRPERAHFHRSLSRACNATAGGRPPLWERGAPTPRGEQPRRRALRGVGGATPPCGQPRDRGVARGATAPLRPPRGEGRHGAAAAPLGREGAQLPVLARPARRR